MNYRRSFNEFSQLLSLFLTFGESFGLLYVWVEAYISLDKSTIVYVNRFGEAIPELILWIVILPICVYGCYLNFKMLSDGFRQKK